MTRFWPDKTVKARFCQIRQSRPDAGHVNQSRPVFGAHMRQSRPDSSTHKTVKARPWRTHKIVKAKFWPDKIVKARFCQIRQSDKMLAT